MKGERKQAHRQRPAVKLDPGTTYARLLSSLMTDLAIEPALQRRYNGLARSRSYATLVREAGALTKQMYGDPEEHFRMYQLAFFITKAPFVDPGLNPRQAAIDGFMSTERRNRILNTKLRRVHGVLNGVRYCPPENWRYLEWIPRARRLIARVLGPLDVTEVYRECYFGDGSSNGCSGSRTHVINKMRNLTCTPVALPYLKDAFAANAQIRRIIVGDDVGPLPAEAREIWNKWFEENVRLVDHNEVDFVRKKAEIDRVIAKEPNGNGFLQLGAGWVIAKKLRRVHINIQDQTPNQLFARFGSECYLDVNAPATLDLTDASNFPRWLVKLLLPEDWYVFLNSLRSPSYTLDGCTPRPHELFASMGNGFCFPLETLMFWGICRSACDDCGVGPLAVYGDDIALPKGAALLAIERLTYVGLRINTAKSFIHGPFRESCGADFYAGTDVRPFVLDFVPSMVQDLVKIANGLQSRGREFPCTVKTCIELTPREVLFLKPHLTGAVDDAILVPEDIFMGSGIATKWDADRQTWNFRVWRSQSQGEIPQLPEPWELLALYHGTTSSRKRDLVAAGLWARRETCPDQDRLGKPVLPVRFTAKTRGRWYLPPLDKPPETSWWQRDPAPLA